MKNFSLELFCNDLSLKMNNFKVFEDSSQHHQFQTFIDIFTDTINLHAPYRRTTRKEKTASFYSGRWNTGTNPDLVFASVSPNSRLPDRRVLEKFSRSQNRPSLITPSPRFAMAVPSMPVKRCNFCKAKRSHYIALTNKFAKTLLPPDSLDVDAAYQDFCNTIKKAAKKTIPRGYRNNYIPCWDAECESRDAVSSGRRLKFGCYSSACQA